MKPQPAIFEEHEIRRVYDEATETWLFSVIDIVQVLTQQPDYQTARKYWNKLKERLGKEGSESVTNCHRLKLSAADGKNYLTDVATAETLLRLVQSVPSPKAEPIKLWLAKVGYERMQEMADPALSLARARETWQKHGRSEKWIQQRMTGQETRNKLTDYWANHDVKKGEEYAILTNIIHQEWAEESVKAHKEMKGLQTHNLRDHMSEAELISLRWRNFLRARSPRVLMQQAWQKMKLPPKRAEVSPRMLGGNWKRRPARKLWAMKIFYHRANARASRKNDSVRSTFHLTLFTEANVLPIRQAQGRCAQNRSDQHE